MAAMLHGTMKMFCKIPKNHIASADKGKKKNNIFESCASKAQFYVSAIHGVCVWDMHVFKITAVHNM